MQSRLCEINLPLLVIHGEEDTLCTLAGSRNLFDQATTEDKTLWVGLDDNHVSESVNKWVKERLTYEESLHLKICFYPRGIATIHYPLPFKTLFGPLRTLLRPPNWAVYRSYSRKFPKYRTWMTNRKPILVLTWILFKFIKTFFLVEKLTPWLGVIKPRKCHFIKFRIWS